jgi:hypothetical protein
MNKPSFEEVLSLSFQKELSNLYTAIPCKITNIPTNLSDLRVDVQPIIDQLYADGVSEQHPQILGVPVVFPAGRDSMMSFPLFVGDTVLCIFSQAGMDTFKSGGGEFAPPPDFRKMDSRDAVAIPGLVPFAKSLNNASVRTWSHNTSDFVVAHNIGSGREVEVRMKPSGDIIINTNQNATVNCNNASVNAESSFSVVAPTCSFQCDSFTVNTSTYSMNATGTASWASSGATNWSGTVNHTGTFTFNGITFGTHRHTGVQPGGGTSAGPTN